MFTTNTNILPEKGYCCLFSLSMFMRRVMWAIHQVLCLDPDAQDMANMLNTAVYSGSFGAIDA